jgi:hypothetical protein
MTYWARVKVALDEHKLVDPNFNMVHTDHNQSGMSHHWGIVQGCCKKCMAFKPKSQTMCRAARTSLADQVSRIQTEITNHFIHILVDLHWYICEYCARFFVVDSNATSLLR